MHDFFDRLSFSEGIDHSHDVMGKVAEMIPNATKIKRADRNDDRNGTDFWIERTHGLPPISIDAKNRSFCPIEKYNSDDVCIETTSVYVGKRQPPYRDDLRRKIGWTLNYTKRTDYILYTWQSSVGIRYWILPFLPLCAASIKNWRDWSQTFKERPAENKTYLTLSLYPTRIEVAKKMREFMQGVVVYNQDASKNNPQTQLKLFG